MDTFKETIKTVEDRWLDALYNHCRVSFSGIHLPSHDHTHHLRVWQYARGIISSLWKQGKPFSQEDIESLIIAVFFHDLGMTLTHSREHGKESRRLCKEYFSRLQDNQPANLPEILSMIELHDDKEYIESSLSGSHSKLPAILNIADDLDAFGYVGIYRYAEIYHLRGIAVADMPAAILPNLDNRFNHFSQFPGMPGDLLEYHRVRYLQTKTFFTVLNNDCQSEDMENSWSVKVINRLLTLADTPGMKVEKLWMKQEDEADPDISAFFGNFSQEWLSGMKH